MSTQYGTGEQTQDYWNTIIASNPQNPGTAVTSASVTYDVASPYGYQQAGNLSSSGTLTGQSVAGNNYAAQMRYLAQASIVAGVPQVPASGVVVSGMTAGGYPNNSTTGFGTTFTNVAGSPGATQNNVQAGVVVTDPSKTNYNPTGLGTIYNWTPQRYMA